MGSDARKRLEDFEPILHSQLLLQGKLNDYLADLEEKTQQRLEAIIRQLQKSKGVTEQLKAQDQMLWIRLMGNILQRAEEIIREERIFA